MTEPVPLGRWPVAGHVLLVIPGGKHGPLDRILRVDGEQLTFRAFILGLDSRRWPTVVEDAIRRFFHRNEDVAVAPGGMGAGMLRAVEDRLCHEGLDAALALLDRTMRPGFRRADILAHPPDSGLCPICGRQGDLRSGHSMGLGDIVCHRCWWKAARTPFTREAGR